MANYRLSMKRGKIGYAKPHAEYVLREGKYSKGYKKEELQYRKSGNMPKWGVEDPVAFWEAADIFEPINGRTYTEFEISLPNELTLEENMALVNEFKDTMLGKDHAYTYAIHTSYNNGQMNTHAHFMFTERKNDGIERDKDAFFKRANYRYPERGGASKDREWQHKDTLLNAREQFATITNKHLERSGISERVDHRSNEAQMIEAIEKGDLDKIEYLTRYPVSIPGRLLNKAEKSLTQWEKQEISNFYVNRQIKREKENIYKEKLNHKEPLEKEDLILEVKKLDKNLDENKLKKSTLNAITNGNYYKHQNRAWELRKEIRENPTNLDLKKNLEEVRNSIKDIEDYLPNTSRYIAKYKALENAYSKKRNFYIKELESHFNILESDMSNFHTEEELKPLKENIKTSKLRINIDLNNHFQVKDNLENISQKIEYLNGKLADGDQIKNQAMDRVTGHKFSALKSMYKYIEFDSSKDEYFKNLKKECGELYSKLEDPAIKTLIAKESYQIISHIQKEVEQLELEKSILETNISKTTTPNKDTLDKHNVERLIALRAEHQSFKFNIDKLEKKIIDTSLNKDLTSEEIEKNTAQYAKFLINSIEKASIIESLVEKQEGLVKKLSTIKVIEATREFDDIEMITQNKLKTGVQNLEKLVNSKEKITELAINHLTKGKFNKLEAQKEPFKEKVNQIQENINILESKIQMTSSMRFLEKHKYTKELKTLKEHLKPYKERHDYFVNEQKNLVNDLGSETINIKSKELHDNFSKALNKAKNELSTSKGKTYISSELIRVKYKEMPRTYSRSHSKNNSMNLKDLDNLLKDNISPSQMRQTTKCKIFKKEREEDVVELER